MNAFIANAQIGVDDNTKFTLGYLKTNSNENTLSNNHKNNGIGLYQVKIHIC